MKDHKFQEAQKTGNLGQYQYDLAKTKSNQLTESKLHDLLVAIVKSNLHQADVLIKENPRFLLNTFRECTEQVDRKHDGLTPMQLALCLGDIELFSRIKLQLLMLEDGQEIYQQQFNKIFPNGINDHKTFQESNAFGFSLVFTSILMASKEDCTAQLENPLSTKSELGKALARFRQDFDEKSKSEIIFNPYHILKAFQTFGIELEKFKSNKQNKLACRMIIGFVQRYLPASYAKKVANGMYDINENYLPLHSSQEYNGRQLIAPWNPNGRLGLSYWLFSGGLKQSGGLNKSAFESKGCLAFFEDHITQYYKALGYNQKNKLR